MNTVERKFILFIGDFILLSIVLYNFSARAIDSFDNRVFQVAIILFGLGLYFFLAYILEFYKLERVSQKVGLGILKGLFVSLLFISIYYFVIHVLVKGQFNHKHLILFTAFFPVELILWRTLFEYIFKFVPTTRKVLLLYDNLSSNDLKEYIGIINGQNINTDYKVQIYHNVEEVHENDKSNYRKLYNSMLNIDSIILSTRNFNHFGESLEKIIINAVVSGKEVITFNSFYQNIYQALPVKSHNDSFYEILNLKNRKIRYLQKIVSVVINFSLSIVVGLVFILCTPFVFILNIFLNPGPLLYSQLRIGQHGKEFRIYKFRSMVVDAEKHGAKMATKNDPRITPFGRILRRFRIDELPQVISIAKGDMSFIGPRPERPNFVHQLNELSPFYNSRHLVKPGITGWAQVNYKYGENLEDSIRKLEYDLYYIKNQTVTLDFRIVLKTISTVIFSRGL